MFFKGKNVSLRRHQIFLFLGFLFLLRFFSSQFIGIEVITQKKHSAVTVPLRHVYYSTLTVSRTVRRSTVDLEALTPLSIASLPPNYQTSPPPPRGPRQKTNNDHSAYPFHRRCLIDNQDTRQHSQRTSRYNKDRSQSGRKTADNADSTSLPQSTTVISKELCHFFMLFFVSFPPYHFRRIHIG